MRDDIRTYKPFVDGLRAVAILTVVASHLDLPWLAGGYVGVDIFFVISGYLIINQILADIADRKFSVAGFYARRAWRILPAFILVMLTTLVLVTTVFVQPEYKNFARSFFFSSIMLANHFFLAHQGYFDVEAFSKPLLHMWSLAVEEQFYILAPLTLLGLSAAIATLGLRRRTVVWTAAVAGLGILSFAACVAFTFPPERANISFYAMPMRGWEFILGGAVPLLARWLKARPAFVSECAGAAGLAAVALAVVLYDADTLYPSWRAAVPVVGTVLIIASGLAAPGNGVARLLSARLMIGIGLVSYPWYLWHWPLISFARTMSFGSRNLPLEFGAAALALGLAVLTYLFLERPIRRWRRSHGLRPVLISVAAPVLCVLVACIGYVWSMQVAPRMLPEIAGLEPYQAAGADYPPVAHRGILLGDSHAAVVASQVADRARQAGSQIKVIVRAGCPPLRQATVTDFRGEPRSFCPEFFRRIAFADAEFLILVARWNFYLGLPPSDSFRKTFTLVHEEGTARLASPYDVMARGLALTIAEARRSGVQRILIVAPLPEFPVPSPYCLMRSIRVGVDNCTIPRAPVDARRARTMEILRRVAAAGEGIKVLDPIDLFCSESECRPNEGRTLNFFDSNHLSATGFARLFKAHEKDFLWVLTGKAGPDEARAPEPAALTSRDSDTASRPTTDSGSPSGSKD
ncbi:MAG: acyltransferase [Pseudorhodoplanes sp.]|nr:acyltransferase [Pseudorhodoplanes sp.]